MYSTCVQQEIRRATTENSLRILTAVINGMRHWGQFKDRVSILFEIFGQFVGCCLLSVFIYVRVRMKTSGLSLQPLWTLQSRWATTGRRIFSWETERRSYSVSSMKMWVWEVKSLTCSCVSVEQINENNNDEIIKFSNHVSIFYLWQSLI